MANRGGINVAGTHIDQMGRHPRWCAVKLCMINYFFMYHTLFVDPTPYEIVEHRTMLQTLSGVEGRT